MKIIFLKIKKHKIKLVVLTTIFLLPTIALAQKLEGSDFGEDFGVGILAFFANLFLAIINFLGAYILLPLINLLVKIVSYNNFLDSNAVTIGWPLVRDVSNMFFVVFLLVIAFSTILKISNYHYKNTLFKLILMAILINFSKTIMGFFIDFGQVIMLTFVNAFRDAAANNLVNAFGLTEILHINAPDPAGGDTINNWEIFASLLLGIILLVIAIGVMLAYVSVLLYRIISLWVLVILSPLAFLLSAFASTTKYASELWTKFWQQLTTGIILAFFLWLALSILAAGFGGSELGSEAAGQSQGGATAISQWERFYSFIVATALMLIALQYSQQAGGFAGKFAGKVSGKLSDWGSKAARKVTAPLRGAGTLAKEGAGYVKDKVETAIGIPLKAQDWKDGWTRGKEVRRKRRRDAMLARSTKRGGMIGALGTPDHFFSDRWNWGIFKRTSKEGLAGRKIKKRQQRYNTISEQLYRLDDIDKRAEMSLGKDELEKYRELKLHGVENLDAPNLATYNELENKKNNNLIGLKLDASDESLLKGGVKIEDDEGEVVETVAIGRNLNNLGVAIGKLSEERAGVDSKLRDIRGPVNYDMKKRLRGGYLDELKNVTSTEWKELVVDLEDAIARKDFDKAGAVLLKATSDGNANEVLNSFNYSSSGEGMKQFIMRELVGKKGMTRKERAEYNRLYSSKYGKIDDAKGVGMSMNQSLLLGTDVGYAAEKILHWQDARLTSAGPDGNLSFYGPEERQLEIAYETGKIAYDKLLQNANRLVGYEEIPVGTPEEYNITGDRDSLVQTAWVERSLNSASQIIYSLARGRVTESHLENFSKDQNYVLWRKIAEEKLKGSQKEEFITLLNIIRELGLKSLRSKGYDNDSEKKHEWRRKELNGPEGHLATILKQTGLKYEEAVDNYDSLRNQEGYRNDMNTFNGKGQIDVKVKGTDLYIENFKMGGDFEITDIRGKTQEELKEFFNKLKKDKAK